MSFAGTWMNLEVIIGNEVRQSQISHDINYMWNVKIVVQINLFTKQKQSHRCRKQTFGYQGKCWGGITKHEILEAETGKVLILILRQRLTVGLPAAATSHFADSNNSPRQHIKKQKHYFANKGLSRLWFSQWSCMDMRAGL